MEERKVGLVPRVQILGALGLKDYGVLLTDRRSIFVLETSSHAALGGALGGALGAAIAQAATAPRLVDYEGEDPERLASAKGSIEVPHEGIQRLRMKRHRAGGHTLRFEYVRSDGKRKKLEVMVVPPDAQIRANKARGIKPKETTREYAAHVQAAFQKALPAAAAARAEWVP
jgi:hypothetical protein